MSACVRKNKSGQFQKANCTIISNHYSNLKKLDSLEQMVELVWFSGYNKISLKPEFRRFRKRFAYKQQEADPEVQNRKTIFSFLIYTT